MNKKIMKRYRQKFYEKNMLNYVLTICATICSSISSVLLAGLLKELMDIAGGGSMEGLKRCLVLTLAVVAGFCVVFLVMRSTKYNFMRKAVTGYRNLAFQDITAKSISSLGKNNSSDYISALTNDVTSIESKYLLAEFSMLESLLTAALSLVLMFYYSWVMTLAVIGLCILPVIVSVIFGSRVAEQEKQISDCNAGFVAMVKDLLSGFSVIKSFQAQEEAGTLYADRNENLEQIKCRRQKTVKLIELISALAGISVQMGVFLLGAYLAIRGQITAGVVVAFVQMMNYVLDPINQVPVLLADRKAAEGLIEKLAVCCVEEEDSKRTESVSSVGEGIRFEHVNFSYEEGKNVLKDVNLEFDAGKSYAIVGGSGSGKSTLLNLIMGSYTGYEGRVTMEGKELREVNADSIFDVVSVIQQNVFIFDDTVRRNICLFKEFPADAVESAATRAGLKDLIAEKGWDYGCGEGGAHLSGGEKQRISIARSLLKESQVLLVDEATSALDAETGDSVTSAILDINGLTRLVVTHKLDEKTLKRFDGIIVMRNGRVAEQGTFGELMDKKDYFYSLYQVSRE
ncbi:MAG: ABC transporter ATP-binding protein [Lachnospiraceae bacterium]|nr:ABC transporter ATP-binding protein [Lachnospiraceae bacterium]